MKRGLLLAFAAVCATLNSYPAVTTNVLTFSNIGATDDKKVWVTDTGLVGRGVPATGTAYRVALYWGPQGTPPGGLLRIGGPAGFGSGGAGGTFFGGGRTIVNPAGTANGQTLTFQVKGWRQVPGVEDSYEAVLAAALNGDPRAYQLGVSLPFTVDTKDPTNPQDLAPDLLHSTRSTFTGFTIAPEPSVISLGLLGVGALLLLRRRLK